MPSVRISDEPIERRRSSPFRKLSRTPEQFSQGSITSLKDQDIAYQISFWDKVAYDIENRIASDPTARFRMLLVQAAGSVVLLGFLWNHAQSGSPDEAKTYSSGYAALKDSVWIACQVLISAGYDDTMETNEQIVVYFMMLMVGVTLVALLIGLITDTVNNYMDSLSDGRTKVTEKGHTLLLGWNESSARVVTQIAFLRKVHQLNNASWKQFFLPWLRVRPSSPVAGASAIIMCNEDKQEIEKVIGQTFSERGVSSLQTKIGRDVVFRMGNPCDAHDLVRAGAHNAASILVMMTKVDTDEKRESPEATPPNSATIRCLLALRNVLANPSDALPGETFSPSLSCVVCQLSQECEYLKSTTFARLDGRPLLHAHDITASRDTMLFNCAVTPGLSRVFMNLLNFEGTALRSRRAEALAAGPRHEVGWMVGKTVRECLVHHHWDNGILLGFDEEACNFYEKFDPSTRTFRGDYGIGGDPERLVLSSDYVVFLSTSSSPGLVQGGGASGQRFVELTDSFKPNPTKAMSSASMLRRGSTVRSLSPLAQRPQRKAKEVKKEFAAGRGGGGGGGGEQRVLVLGWRDEWEEDPLRVEALLGEMGEESVNVTFFNIKTLESMDEFCNTFGFHMVSPPESLGSAAGASGGGGWKSQHVPNVTLNHHQGVPIEYDAVEALFKRQQFDTAIVLGSVAGIDLPDSTRDARVLSMLLILRQLNMQSGSLMHIIAENQLDQTSALALAPARTENVEPDFINTQAIVARTLVMSLAYPQISRTVFELFQARIPAQPEIEFLSTSSLGIEGREMPFGALSLMINNLFDGRGIAIGYFHKSTLLLVPPPAENVAWTSEHRVVAIVRSLHGLEGVGGSASGSFRRASVEEEEDEEVHSFVESDATSAPSSASALFPAAFDQPAVPQKLESLERKTRSVSSL